MTGKSASGIKNDDIVAILCHKMVSKGLLFHFFIKKLLDYLPLHYVCIPKKNNR